MIANSLVKIAQRAKTKGLAGWVKAELGTESKIDFKELKSISFGLKTKRVYKIEDFRLFGQKLEIKLIGLDSIEAITPFIGQDIYCLSDELPMLKAGQYYNFQLINKNVETKSGQKLGRVIELMDNKLQTLLVINGGEFGEVLVPLLENTVVAIDSKLLVIELEPDLITLNT